MNGKDIICGNAVLKNRDRDSKWLLAGNARAEPSSLLDKMSRRRSKLIDKAFWLP